MARTLARRLPIEELFAANRSFGARASNPRAQARPCRGPSPLVRSRLPLSVELRHRILGTALAGRRLGRNCPTAERVLELVAAAGRPLRPPQRPSSLRSSSNLTLIVCAHPRRSHGVEQVAQSRAVRQAA